MADDLQVLGISTGDLPAGWAEVVEDDRCAKQETESDFPVWHGNWETVQVFLAVGTNWKVLVLPDGSLKFQGISCSAIKAAMWGYEVPKKRRKQVFAGVRLMEEAALAALYPAKR